jgi:hypothetical protein
MDEGLGWIGIRLGDQGFDYPVDEGVFERYPVREIVEHVYIESD